jgi:hypothetical protein
MAMRSSTFLVTLSLISVLVCLSSCLKDDSDGNYSPTQELPADPQDSIPDNNNNPGDTIPEAIDMLWFADIPGASAFYGDSATMVYAFDSVLQVHTFTCTDQMGREMTIVLENLNPGIHTLNFDTNIISVQDDTVLFNGTVNPTGFLNIQDTTQHLLTAVFQADLSSFTTGAQMLVRNGVLDNIPFE